MASSVPTSTTMRATVAAYDALQAVALDISRAIPKNSTTSLYVVTGDADLDGLADFHMFHHIMEGHRRSLETLRADSGRSSTTAREFGFVAPIEAVSKIVSGIVVPLTPKFTFADAQVSIDNLELATLVGGAMGEDITVYTPMSVAIRQSDPKLVASIAALDGLLHDARAILLSLAEQTTSEAGVRRRALEDIESSLVALTKRIGDNAEYAGRLVRGAALNAILINAQILRVRVVAAGTEVHERGIVMFSKRTHTAAVAAAYALYTGTGRLIKGGLVRHTATLT